MKPSEFFYLLLLSLFHYQLQILKLKVLSSMLSPHSNAIYLLSSHNFIYSIGYWPIGIATVLPVINKLVSSANSLNFSPGTALGMSLLYNKNN